MKRATVQFGPGQRFTLNGVEHLVTAVDTCGGRALKTFGGDRLVHLFTVGELETAQELAPEPIRSKAEVVLRAREFYYEARYSGRSRRWFLVQFNHLRVMVTSDVLALNLRASGVIGV